MKTLLFTVVSTLMFFTIQGAITKEEIEKFKGLHEKCSKDSGFDVHAVIKNIDDEADNKEFKCFLKCMMVELGSMDESGALHLDKVKAQETDLKPEVWEKAVEGCKDLDDDDICEKAFKLTKCVSDQIHAQMS